MTSMQELIFAGVGSFLICLRSADNACVALPNPPCLSISADFHWDKPSESTTETIAGHNSHKSLRMMPIVPSSCS